MPLGQMTELFQMAYFHEAREIKGMGLGDVADLFGKSLRTVSSLHNRFRGDFFAPEQEMQLRRDIAQRIQDGATSFDELRVIFPKVKEIELLGAIDDLLREKRILESHNTFRRNPEDHDFFSETDIRARVDGLNRQMDIIAEAVWRRFFEEESSREALARSYVFQGTAPEFEAMQQALSLYIRDRAIAVDDAAQGQEGATRCAITIAASPLENKP